MAASDQVSKRRFNFRLSHKIAILLLAPLCVQLILFVSLSYLFEKAQNLAALESQQTELVERLYKLLIDRTDGWGNVISQAITPSRIPFDFSGYIAKIKEDYDSLNAIGITDPEVRSLLADIQKTNAKEQELLYSLSQNGGENVSKIEALMKIRTQLKRRAAISTTLTLKIGLELNEVSAKRALARAAMQQARWQLDAGIALNLLAAAGTFFFFIRQLNKRLWRLTENASYMAKPVPLPYTISGEDELAELDLVLHKTRESLDEAKSERQSLIAMIVHDLRSPIMSNKLIVDALIQSDVVKQSDVILKKASSLNTNTKRIAALVDDLLTVEKLESGTLEMNFDEVNLKLIVSDALCEVEEPAKAASVMLVNGCEDCDVIADPGRLLQVLVNYLSNAIKFSPAHSDVRVLFRREKGRVYISVADNGVGIPKEDQVRLFEKYFRTEAGKRHKGFGLGLAICKMIVRQHGGDVGVISKPREGTTFWFSLPDDAE